MDDECRDESCGFNALQLRGEVADRTPLLLSMGKFRTGFCVYIYIIIDGLRKAGDAPGHKIVIAVCVCVFVVVIVFIPSRCSCCCCCCCRCRC